MLVQIAVSCRAFCVNTIALSLITGYQMYIDAVNILILSALLSLSFVPLDRVIHSIRFNILSGRRTMCHHPDHRQFFTSADLSSVSLFMLLYFRTKCSFSC